METRFWATKGFSVITRRMGFTSFFKSLFMLFLFLYIMELQRDAEMVHSISDVQSILPPIFDCHGIAKTALCIALNKPLCPRKIFLYILECCMAAFVHAETVGVVAEGWLIDTLQNEPHHLL